MDKILVIAVIAITLALAFYTIGVWWERREGTLKSRHVILFWIGLILDTTGTTAMTRIANNGLDSPAHGIMGTVAILLMVFHASWATITLKSRNEKKLKNFHRLSFLVWLIWLIPFFSGMLMGIRT